MENQPFVINIDNVILHKIGSKIVTVPDLQNSIDITPQVGEIRIYQSIFMPLMKAKISINDQIGLLVNFPLTGEEAVSITYTQNNKTETKYFVIETVGELNPLDNLRGSVYIMNLVSFESLANVRSRVSQSFNTTPEAIIATLKNDYIDTAILKIFPDYPVKVIECIDTEGLLELPIVVPNQYPLKAMSWITSKAVSSNPDWYTFCLYEDFQGIKFKCLQGLHFQDQYWRNQAYTNRYKYISNEMPDSKSYKNKGRNITSFQINRRLSSANKIVAGYFQNTLVEVNMAQKAFFMTETTNEDLKTLDRNSQNRKEFEEVIRYRETDNEEDGNAVQYTINNYKDSDPQFTNPDYRSKWGKVRANAAALAQIDLTIVVPGDVALNAGNLIYLELPEMHGFNTVNADDLISGFYIITEAMHTLATGGSHSTTLTLNKDSYGKTVDRESRYK